MNAVLLPILIPLTSAVLLLVLRGRDARFAVSLLSAALTVAASAALLSATLNGEAPSSNLGGWAAPFGIAVVADGLSAISVTAASLVALLTVLLSRGTTDERRERFGHHALLHLLFAGVNQSFLTGDLFNLFVAFEVMLVASYALMVLGNDVGQLREGFRYVVFNLLVSAVFVVAAGFAYGLLGTLNFADLALRSAPLGPNASVTALTLLLMFVFASKTALFPLSFWLPGAYPEPPPAVSAYFAAVLTKVGAYALIRLLTTVFPTEPHVTHTIVLVLGSATVLVGALGALSQRTWRSILSFTVVSSVGYLGVGLGLNSPDALTATVFYLAQSMLVTFGLFAVAALAERFTGTESVVTGGLLSRSPLLAAAYFVGLLALVGLPPTSGFVAKLGLVRAAAEVGTSLAFLGIGAILLGSFLTLVTLASVWRSAFWGESRRAAPAGRFLTATTLVAGAVTASLIVVSGPLYASADRIAAELANPGEYAREVLP
ncbi:proton-conducting transporter membrane subunit [Deinococcus yavapaiensis]|uniref:Multisubunit sodium/proton antiporter MrpD subunit n=1 Tax=Deinococcus yavapaiensis KR-236 TaxID=694435 RepID=A0A318SAT9_9DEIO|nr:proton-conducting transporter membrane subunit [Deinococcus yavapaiensis]PYE56540.1 multisubunit sodium/proton antiporter MrpD subunit [Deinococcus yavapaiensis KR-236]